MLPKMINPDGISKWRSVDFGGIIHTLAAGNGDIWDDENIISDEYPVLVTRAPEHKIQSSFAGKYGVLQIGPAETDVILVGASAIKYKGKNVTASFSEVQTLTQFNPFAIIMPAKKWIRTDVIGIVSSWPASANYGDVYCVGTTCKYWDGSAWQTLGPIMGNIEASVTTNVTITTDTEAGVPISNTIHGASVDFTSYFQKGDGLTLSGTAFPTEATLVVRNVTQHELTFDDDENVFTPTGTAKSATIKRTMPDLDWLCVNERRAWGCKGKTIYASKLADFKNWNVFEGLASDSYAVDVLSEGDLTGCVSFMGYPVFFKETGIYKVYGNRPSNFEVMGSASTGCVDGRTLAIASETLFYLSRVGVMSYNGGYPQSISDQLGDIITGSFDACAVADGSKYLLWYDGADAILEYDTKRGMWHKLRPRNITGTPLFGARYNNRAGIVTTADEFWAVQSSGTNETIEYFVEWADFTEDVSKAPQYGANKKGTSKVQLRMTLGEDSSAHVKMRFDSEGDWISVKNLATQHVKKSYYLPIIPRRSDHFRIRIEGTGHFELYSLSRENYKGSAI